MEVRQRKEQTREVRKVREVRLPVIVNGKDEVAGFDDVLVVRWRACSRAVSKLIEGVRQIRARELAWYERRHGEE